jgi:peroxiredoxin
MTIFTKKMTAGLACLVSSMTMIGAGTMNESAESELKPEPVKIGQQAPDFTLVDLDGNEHILSEYTAKGNIVVLEWFNPTCPFVRKHYREDTMTMVNMQKEFAEQDIVWLRINSAREGNKTGDVALNKKAVADWGIQTAVLLDPSGTVGRAYGAKRTPEMYVINAAGVLAYHGAIDNNADAASPGEVNYVHNALTDTLAGRECENASNKPYGCSVKY